jgi:hypothetical protein
MIISPLLPTSQALPKAEFKQNMFLKMNGSQTETETETETET